MPVLNKPARVTISSKYDAVVAINNKTKNDFPIFKDAGEISNFRHDRTRTRNRTRIRIRYKIRFGSFSYGHDEN